MNIVKFPNEILTSKSEKITDISEVKEILIEMKDFVQIPENGACGLALPQVGILKRGFVALIDDKVMTFVNPLIIKKSGKKVDSTEGCMSIDNKIGTVTRHKSITVRFYDLNNKMHLLQLSGWNARVVQHELDHLDGVLFTDKAYNVREPEQEESQELEQAN